MNFFQTGLNYGAHFQFDLPRRLLAAAAAVGDAAREECRVGRAQVDATEAAHAVLADHLRGQPVRRVEVAGCAGRDLRESNFFRNRSAKRYLDTEEIAL